MSVGWVVGSAFVTLLSKTKCIIVSREKVLAKKHQNRILASLYKTKCALVRYSVGTLVTLLLKMKELMRVGYALLAMPIVEIGLRHLFCIFGFISQGRIVGR